MQSSSAPVRAIRSGTSDDAASSTAADANQRDAAAPVTRPAPSAPDAADTTPTPPKSDVTPARPKAEPPGAEAGPAKPKAKPSKAEAEPAKPKARPSEAEAGPAKPKARPSEAEAGPAKPKARPSEAEAGPAKPKAKPPKADASPAKPKAAPPPAPERAKPGKTDADILAQARAQLETTAAADAASNRGVLRQQTRRRHRLVLASFLVVVLLPALVAGWYLYTRAADQYASVMAFTVRSEENRSALDVLGRLGGGFAFGGGAASTDGEILYQFIQSQEMVAAIDARLDLRSLFARHHDVDPVFGFRPGGTIEDLTDHWSRKLRIAFDTGTGLMEIRVLAFDPHEAQTIARAILEESTRRINELSVAAREDATRHAREDLDVALERLRTAREAVTEFRIRTQIVDPTADLQGQMGVLNTLQGQLAAALIELDLLRENTREGDPRITQAERRIEVIRARIGEERLRIGGGAGTSAGNGTGGEDYATVMAEFERLNLDREFAEQAYRSALSAFDAAMAEAQRNSRYLATHVAPTLAESPRYPERETLLALAVFFLLLGWAVAVLIYYSVRDSR